VNGVLVLIAAVLVMVSGCYAVVHAEQRRSRWYRLPGPLLPWWQTIPIAWARVRLQPYERDTQNEQLGTTAELIAGIAGFLLGGLILWALTTGSVSVP
jgi:hypothetical protein